VVLLAVLAGGYWFLREPEAVSGPAGILLDAEEAPLRQTLEKIGSIVPAANDLKHPLRRRLIAAGYRDADALPTLFGIKAVSAAGLFFLFFIFSSLLSEDWIGRIVFSACGAGLGFLLPERVLHSLEKRRQQRLRQALPAALDLLVLSIEAGQGLDTALLDTSRELKRVYPDLSEELTLSHLEIRAGKMRSEVLSGLAQRTGELEIRKLCNLLLDGDRFGASLGPALRNHAKYSRLRRRQLAQEQARKTSVKLVFPVFFLVFPSVLLVTLGPAMLRLMQGMNELMNSAR
jgi:tight adherence protein C